MALDVGTKAPDFTLSDISWGKVSLQSLLDEKAVLLVFYPVAFSGVCSGELCQVRDELADYQNDKVQIVGVSVDHPFTLRAWGQAQGYTFPLLADFWPHGEVARTYGVFNDDAGMAERGTFLINREGVIVFSEHGDTGTARDQQAWKDAIAALD
jgi:peroxiredoxin (alkyl hydroperoxide reductase subunit C)